MHDLSQRDRDRAEREIARLVAEDNAANRALLTSMLEGVGFTVREVRDGKAAVEAFHEWDPHLICMDMRMPVMDGYAATEAIRGLAGGEWERRHER